MDCWPLRTSLVCNGHGHRSAQKCVLGEYVKSRTAIHPPATPGPPFTLHAVCSARPPALPTPIPVTWSAARSPLPTAPVALATLSFDLPA